MTKHLALILTMGSQLLSFTTYYLGCPLQHFLNYDYPVGAYSQIGSLYVLVPIGKTYNKRVVTLFKLSVAWFIRL